MKDLLQLVQSKAQTWLDSPAIDDATKAEVKSLLTKTDSKELIDNFYKDLEFGTGGLRGIMGVGSNCMNKYTVGVATQGLANYLNKTFPGKKINVAIAHDSRNNGRFFAQVAADVLSANGIDVHMFAELRPTPLLSFAIRYLKCDSGIVVTASHNPKEYNGYKAYWNDGAQVVPPH
ncbi:MAG: phosphoglucomutase, partial [Marivirga sp.]|nr:phosphoglucomutase [Marivirga sp.]